MHWHSLLRQVLQNLYAYRLQSILALVSVIGASAALYSALTFRALAAATAEAQFGTMVVTVTPYPQEPMVTPGQFAQAQLRMPADVIGMGYTRLPGSMTVHGRPVEGYGMAASLSLLPVLQMEVVQGRLWTPQELERYARMCVVGAEIAVPVGEVIAIGGVACEVIGVLADRAPLGLFEAVPNQLVWVPLESMVRFHPQQAVEHFYFVEKKGFSPPSHHDGMKPWIKDQLADWAIAQYQWQDATRFMEGLQAQHAILKNSLWGMTGILLLLSGIQLGSALLMHIRARVMEIGLRYCLGATTRHLYILFLAEILLLSAVGAGAGIGLGIGMTAGLAWWLGWTYTFSPIAASITVFLMLLLGAIAGIYPIYRITRWEPIQLLNFNH